ncbi:MAG: hypothetical protein HOO06_00840 [Bdellovibrionaceae bacterium]|nr:hypothetical protein [Pseudobdellovibrionaceae bacterium]
MKKIEDIFKELGFDANGPTGAQKAFVRSLIKLSNEQSPRTNKFQEKANVLKFNENHNTGKQKDYKQLAFDLETAHPLSKSRTGS